MAKLQRKTKIFIGIAVPVVLVLIAGVIVICASLETCECPQQKEDCLCVALNSDNKTVNKKVYDGGIHVIGPTYHFSKGLPAYNNSIVCHIQTGTDDVLDDTQDPYYEDNDTSMINPIYKTQELTAFVVLKFYINESKVYDFYNAMPSGFISDEYEFSSQVSKNATPIVTEILTLFNCSEYKAHQDEDYWIQEYGKVLVQRFNARTDFLFTLDKFTPVKAVFLDSIGCGQDG